MKKTIIKTNDFKETLYTTLCRYNGKNLNLMISGGSLLHILSYEKYSSLSTEKWRVFYADERCDQNLLNHSDAQSFRSLIRGKFHRIPTEKCTEKCTECYRQLLGDRRMDVCLLGVGENGHICSLWPDTPELNSEEPVIRVRVPTAVSPERVTVTLWFINRAVDECFFVIPPKNGVVKKVTEPHRSISERILIDYTVILPSEQ